MIDYSNTDGFKDLPSLPSGLECPLLENNMGEGSPLCPWLHFAGLLPFIMKTIKISQIVCCRKNTENIPKHRGHMYSHVLINVKTNSASREGKINVLQSYMLQTLK
jgi:hypothetical protein